MRELRERLARGEQAAFAELYEACADRLHHYLVARLQSREDADDVLQETFVRLARSRRRLARVEALMPYVFTMARNEAVRLAQHKSRQRNRGAGAASEALFCEAHGDDLQARETAEMVTVALNRLSPQRREILELKIYAGFTFREIAEITGQPQGTVATRYRAALDQLRGWLTKEMS